MKPRHCAVLTACLIAPVILVVPPSAKAGETFESVDATLPPVRALIERYSADRQNLRRFYDAPLSETAWTRREQFLRECHYALEAIDFDGLDQDGRIDYLLLRNELRFQLATLDHERHRLDEMRGLLPFAGTIIELQETRRRLEPIDPPALARTLADLAETVKATQKDVQAAVDADDEDEDEGTSWKPTVANRAAGAADDLRNTLEGWYGFYDGYDPLFTWWAAAPYGQAVDALKDYAKFLRKTLAGIDDGDDDAILGDPIGRDELLARLALEMIPYTPEELLAIAELEMAWCRAEMLEASRELGYGDDWKAALDHVKDLHVQPGEQPALVRELAREAVEFVEARDLVTVPELCKETWRMEMMTPQRQKTSPYFLGGEVIMVAFPTDEMAQADKLMSLRGNNRHFARATVHHELIPGHHLQQFMMRRHRTHRREFSTPFWMEGWALYWEMRLWDLGFPQSPEDRIGMLFWRSHRCARIIFSLSFHLELMNAQECIDYLVDNVGHERNNATAEVRRSVSGDYGPLYQAAYMLGGLQIRALHDEVVGSGALTEREFHDTVLMQNSIPIEMVRAALTEQPLTRDYETSWKFYGDVDE